MPIKNSPIYRYGNKQKDLKYFIDYLPKDIKTVCEPFAGSFAVIRNVYDDPKYNIHINDIDKKFMNTFGEIVNNIEEYYKMREFPPPSYCPYEEMKEHIDKFNFTDETKEEIYRTRIAPRGCATTFPKKVKYDGLKELWNRATITHKDYKEILEQYKDDEEAFLFLDPPYLNSSNKDYNTGSMVDEKNNIIDNTEYYIDILNFMKICKCKVLLVINNNAVMRYVFRKHILGQYNKTYASSRKENLLIVGKK